MSAPPPARPYADEVGADPGSLRIGLLDHHPRDEWIHDDCVDAVRAAAALLEGLGHRVEPGSPAVLADASFTPRFMALWATSMALGIEAFGTQLGRTLTADDVEPVNWAQAEFARTYSAVDLADGPGGLRRLPPRRAAVVDGRLGPPAHADARRTTGSDR